MRLSGNFSLTLSIILYYEHFYCIVSAVFPFLFIERDSRNHIHSLVVLSFDPWVSLICVC